MGDLLNCDPVENSSQEMKQPSGDRFEFKDRESNMSPGGFHNRILEQSNTCTVKSL